VFWALPITEMCSEMSVIEIGDIADASCLSFAAHMRFKFRRTQADIRHEKRQTYKLLAGN